jgi:hypothetical protein
VERQAAAGAASRCADIRRDRSSDKRLDDGSQPLEVREAETVWTGFR